MFYFQGVTDSNHSPKVERLKLEQTDDDDEYEPELQRLATEGDGGQYTPLDTATTANSELLREARMLSRAHHGSPSMTPLGEQVSYVIDVIVLCGVFIVVLCTWS